MVTTYEDPSFGEHGDCHLVIGTGTGNLSEVDDFLAEAKDFHHVCLPGDRWWYYLWANSDGRWSEEIWGPASPARWICCWNSEVRCGAFVQLCFFLGIPLSWHSMSSTAWTRCCCSPGVAGSSKCNTSRVGFGHSPWVLWNLPTWHSRDTSQVRSVNRWGSTSWVQRWWNLRKNNVGKGQHIISHCFKWFN